MTVAMQILAVLVEEAVLVRLVKVAPQILEVTEVLGPHLQFLEHQ
jgi:hypothetical protein